MSASTKGRTYTAHRLTDAMLQRLEHAVMVGETERIGVDGVALMNHGGLVELFWEGHRQFMRPTDAGRAALEQARQEGWQ